MREALAADLTQVPEAIPVTFRGGAQTTNAASAYFSKWDVNGAAFVRFTHTFNPPLLVPPGATLELNLNAGTQNFNISGYRIYDTDL